MNTPLTTLILATRGGNFIARYSAQGLAAAMNCTPPRDFLPNEVMVRNMLRGEGAEEVVAASNATRLVDYFKRAAHCDNVKFIFSADHLEAANELTLIDKNGAELRADRAFVTVDGERWLIDFKFSTPGDEFALANEADRYRAQLLSYAERLRELDRMHGSERQIRVALYFPWVDVLHEIGV